MASSWHVPRRTFLKGLGVSLALPHLDIMNRTAKAADAGAAPLRMLSIFQPNGVYPKKWDVTGEGKDFELSHILEPFSPVKDQLLVLSNIDNVGTKGHVQMTGSFLTGVAMKGQRHAASLDQMIAKKYGHQTRFPSIVLGTEPPRQGGASGNPIAFANTVSWSSATTRLSPEINPRVAFDRLFRNQNSPEARRKNLNRQSVVDLVLEDATALKRKASKLDQHKIDEYLASVRSVEQRIDRNLNPPARSWVPPTTPTLVRPADGIPKRRDEHLRLMMDLIVLAFQTDTTRVGTMMTAHGFSRQNFSFLDGVNSDHHGMSHHKDQATTVAEYTQVSRWYASMVSKMLQKMAAIDEGNGSMLDNSIVMYGSGMKDGNGHVRENLPLLLAGQGQGKLKTGRHLVNPKSTPIANLLYSLSHKFDLELDRFNNASTGTIDI